MALVEIRNLNVTFKTARGLLHAVENLDLSLEEGELLGIVGESGSGKSVTMLALMGLIPWPGKVTADRLTFDGKDILKLSAAPAPADHRQGYRHDLPGADDEPEPLLHRRLPDHGDAARA